MERRKLYGSRTAFARGFPFFLRFDFRGRWHSAPYEPEHRSEYRPCGGLSLFRVIRNQFERFFRSSG
jgi:hypothetical protein